MAFSHPLARGAKVWTAKTHDGEEQRVLVIITTIPLEPDEKGYKKSLVERLSRAARDHLAELERSRFVPAHEPDEGLESGQGVRIRRGPSSPAPVLRFFPVLHLRRKVALLINAERDRLPREARARGAWKLSSLRAASNWGSNAMTNAGSVLGLGPGAGLTPLKAKWGWIVALGVVYLIAGVIALGSVVMATIASVYVVGIMMLLAGVFEVIHSFQIKTWGRFLFWLASGFSTSSRASSRSTIRS